MVEHGFTVITERIDDSLAVKQQHKVPPHLYSCHTAIVDGYIVEGHVPAAEVERLLAERPNVLGIAVAGMPIGSPGMEVEGAPNEPFDVIAFDGRGGLSVYGRYRD
jgi:hypothetical protein